MPLSDDSLPPASSTLRQALEALIETLTEQGIPYAIIGGIAMIQHTRARATDDIDVLLRVTNLSLPAFLDALSRRGFQFDLQKTILELRDEKFTTILYKHVLVDLLQPLIPAFSHILDRAITGEIFGHKTSLASPEGLIISKLMSRRPQDQSDIESLMAAYSGKLDLDFIRKEVETFTEPDDPLRSRFGKTK